ncbi:hypothetical protein CF15_04005 [Pyrodictium occultum]|uniref:Uncharacterized protein n=1 Tax=Pyrodictium occultum TaxID=2309 RepID=A0A0V8RV86_PYROC|nr:hypothetical protein [Pyrodictium occultum]KSW11964.1 hypothetical protein CF15_04005 [Pyrodictium occultum]
MLGTLDDRLVIYTGIILTATGASRCIELEAYASLTLLPRVASLGVAVAVEVPVVAQACGMGMVGVVEDVEARVWGRGLYYSSPLLGGLLSRVVMDAYAGEGKLPVERLRSPAAGTETLISSLEGSTAVLGTAVMPLYDLSGLWAVVVRLEKPLERRLAEAVYTNIGALEKAAYDTLDNPVDMIDSISERLAKLTGSRRLQRLRERLLKQGAIAVGLDIHGSHLIVVAEDAETAYTISALNRELGDRVEAPIAVPTA